MTADFVVRKDGSFMLSNPFAASKFRRYLTYWDRIAYAIPYNPIMLEVDDGVDEFREAIDRDKLWIRRTRGPLWNELSIKTGPLLYARSQRAVAISLSQAGTGDWAVARNVVAPNAILPDEYQKEVLEYSLHESLPVPIESISAGRILDFKERRSDEFEAFKFHLSESRRRIAEDGDMGEGLEREIRRLGIALRDTENAMRDARIEYRNQGLRAFMESAPPAALALASAAAMNAPSEAIIALPLIGAGAYMMLRKRIGFVSPSNAKLPLAFAVEVKRTLGA